MPQLHTRLSGYQVELSQVTQADIEQVRQWRNDPAIAQYMLSQEQISVEQQQAWFNKINGDNRQQHFIIRYKGEAIGVANIRAYYQGENLLNARLIEPGLYIASSRYRGNILAFSPALLLNDYCFNILGVPQLLAMVKASNQAALNYNAKLGYKILNSGELIEIRLNKHDYQQASASLQALLNRPVRQPTVKKETKHG